MFFFVYQCIYIAIWHVTHYIIIARYTRLYIASALTVQNLVCGEGCYNYTPKIITGNSRIIIGQGLIHCFQSLACIYGRTKGPKRYTIHSTILYSIHVEDIITMCQNNNRQQRDNNRTRMFRVNSPFPIPCTQIYSIYGRSKEI